MSAGAVAAGCEPVYLPATAKTGFLPDLDALDDELLARTVAFYLASPSNPQGAVADARLSHAAGRARAAASASSCSPTNATRKSTSRQDRRRHAGTSPAPTSPTSSCSIRCRSARTCPGCASASPPATDVSWRDFSTAQCRGAAGAGAGAGGRDRGLQRRGACGGEPPALLGEVRSRRPDHRQPLRLHSARPAASSCGSTCRRRAAAKRSTLKLWREAGVRVHARADISRAIRPTARNPGADYIRVAHGAGPGDHGRGAASPRRRARLNG